MDDTQAGAADALHAHEVIEERRLNAPLGRVWYAWSDAEQLEHWFTEKAEQDFRVGGRYRNSDGDEGEFLEIVPNELIRFTWEQADYTAGGVVTVTFRPDGPDATIVRVEHTNIACDDANDLELGWNYAMDSLVAFMDNGLGLRFEEWAAAKGI